LFVASLLGRMRRGCCLCRYGPASIGGVVSFLYPKYLFLNAFKKTLAVLGPQL